MKLPDVLTFDNVEARRHALRGRWQYVAVVAALGFLALGILGSNPWGYVVAAIYLFLSVAVVRVRYADHLLKQQRAAQLAEHEALLAAMADEAARRELERVTKRADEVAAGLRCPDDCTGCAEEEARSLQDAARWRAKQAARHGHVRTAEEIVDSIENKLDEALHSLGRR